MNEDDKHGKHVPGVPYGVICLDHDSSVHNALDRVQKPSPRRHTGPLKDLLIGILIGAGLMLGCFALGALQVWLGW